MIEAGRVRLPVRDVERALRFYIERLGVKLAAGAVLDLGSGFAVELCKAEVIHPVELVLQVRGDFEEAIATYENRGLALQRVEDDGAQSVVCVDPDGHTLRFVAA